MKDYLQQNKLLVIGIGLVVIVCLIIIGGRFNVEKNNKTYDVVLDFNEVEAMAIQSSQDINWWLQEFKKMGINKVGLTEESIVTLMEDTELPVTGIVMDKLMQDANWKAGYPSDFVEEIEGWGYDSFDVVFQAEGQGAAFLKNGISQRISKDRYILFEEGNKIYGFIDGTADVALYSEKYKLQNSDNTGYQERIDMESSKIMYISLGFLPGKVQTIQEAGMEIVPRTMSYSGWNDTDFARAVVGDYEKYGISPDYIIVGGQAVFGYDDGVDFAKNYIVNNNVTMGLIENTTQLQNIMQYGVEDVAIASGYNAVRIFTVWPYIQNRYQYYGYEGSKEIENTLFRAVVERNIRVIYYKPIFEFEDLHTYVTDIEEYQTLFENLESRLAAHGFEIGRATQMKNYQVNPWLKIIAGIGSVLGALLLLRLLFPIPRKWILGFGIAGVAGVIGMAMAMAELFELTAAFFSAVIIASLGISVFTAQARWAQDNLAQDEKVSKIIAVSIFALLASVLVALLGGLMTAAPISSVNYMLEIDIFRGVKVAQLLPILYYILIFLALFGYSESKKKVGRLEFLDLKELLNLRVKAWMVLVGIIILGLGAYYILRTGHNSTLEVSSIEMVVRNKLEDFLVARPRTKEFLIAFPSIMMMVYCATRRWKLWTILFGLGGVIGITSVCNTFQHIRTPLYLGLYRTGYGLIFGILIGLAGILIFEGLHHLYVTWRKKQLVSNG
ncbi:MAG: DUF5693 family protein [Anaerovoracaceae bacterium]|jgi:MFS family permease|nr:DUF5693 family protein [Anaerovoracaceae bacterium]